MNSADKGHIKTPSKMSTRRCVNKKIAKPRLRRLFRIFTIFGLCSMLLSLGWLNFFGIPKPFHPYITDLLNSDGVNVDFSRINFNILSGIIIREGSLSTESVDAKLLVEFDAAKVGYRFANSKLLPSSINIDGGAIKLTTKQNSLTICEGIKTSLGFSKNDVTKISNFTGDFLSGKIQMNGTITNAWKAISNQSNSQSSLPPKYGPNEISEILFQANSYLANTGPSLKIHFSGNAERPQSFEADIFLNAPKLSSNHFSITNLVTTIKYAPHKKGIQNCAISVRARDARLKISTNQISFHEPFLKFTLPGIEEIQQKKQVVGGKDFEGEGKPSDVSKIVNRNNSLPEAWRLVNKLGNSSFSFASIIFNDQLEIEQPKLSIIRSSNTKGTEKTFQVSSQISSISSNDIRSNEIKINISSIRDIALFASQISNFENEKWLEDSYDQLFAIQAKVDDLYVKGVEIGTLRLSPINTSSGDIMNQTSFSVDFQSGEKISAIISKNSETEPVLIRGKSHYDVKKWSPLFGEQLVDILSRIHWDKPPYATFHLGPSAFPKSINFDDLYTWFSESSDFRGQLDMESGNFKGIPFQNLKGNYSFSDLHWYLKDVEINRPEGTLQINFIQNDISGVYDVDIIGPIFTKALRPLFEENSEYYFSKIGETAPMVGKVTVGGPWDMDLGWVKGHISHKNLSWKTNKVQNLNFYLDYNDTEGMLSLKNVKIDSDPHKIFTKSLTYNRGRDFITIDGAQAKCTPLLIADCIYDEPVELLNSMGFKNPGMWTGGGTIDLGKEPSLVDLLFSLEHDNLTLFGIQNSNFTSQIAWRDDYLIFNNLKSDVLGGHVSGNLNIGIENFEMPTFRAIADATKINLNQIASHLPNKNKIDGLADIKFSLKDGYIKDPDTWEAAGVIKLQDGDLWSIPLFGAVSSIVDGIVPGLGHSVFKSGEINWSMKNGIIDLLKCNFSSSKFGITATGKISTNGNVNGSGKVKFFQAKSPLQRMLNLSLSPFTESLKFRVQGPLTTPNITPSYFIPRIILNPLNPDKWIK